MDRESPCSLAKEGGIFMSLQIKAIKKSFEGKEVLSDVSFSIEDGEFVSLIGPSGSGKSTLFSLIGGIHLPDEGEIYLDEGLIVGKKGDRKSTRLNSSHVSISYA